MNKTMTLRIGMAQINPTVGDLKGNTEKIIDYIQRAKGASVDLLTFPELALPGYPPEDLLLKPYFIQDTRKYLKKIIPWTKGIFTVIGFAEGKEKVHNSAAIIYDQKLWGVYRKKLLPNYGVFDEKRYFAAGEEDLPVFLWGDLVLGISICEDIWEADGPVRWQCRKGKANLIINISSSPYHLGKESIRKKMLKERARENGVIIAYNNMVGGQDELIFDGDSLLVDGRGRILAEGRKFVEDLVISDINIPIKKIKRERENGIVFVKIPYKAGPEKKEVCEEKKKVAREDLRNPRAEVYQALVTGTTDYLRKNGFEKAVIGLSGGIDSALTAVIAVDALGSDNVIGVCMPSPYTSEQSITDARELSGNLGIRMYVLSITPAMKAYEEIFREVFTGLKPNIAEENMQARIRGNILMALSNKFGWLVLTTGNKSETSVGYCTLYGDMAGGFAVIKDVPKVMVYKLAEFRNARAGRAIIPINSITKEPTAELKPGQKDTDSLPEYAVLDEILEKYIEKNWSLKKFISAGYEISLVKKIINMVNNNEYKRRQAPPGIKITPLAFGKDRRFPITQRYREGEK